MVYSTSCEDVTFRVCVIFSFTGGCEMLLHSVGMTSVCHGGMESGCYWPCTPAHYNAPGYEARMLPVAVYVWSCRTLFAFLLTACSLILQCTTCICN